MCGRKSEFSGPGMEPPRDKFYGNVVSLCSVLGRNAIKEAKSGASASIPDCLSRLRSTFDSDLTLEII